VLPSLSHRQRWEQALRELVSHIPPPLPGRQGERSRASSYDEELQLALTLSESLATSKAEQLAAVAICDSMGTGNVEPAALSDPIRAKLDLSAAKWQVAQPHSSGTGRPPSLSFVALSSEPSELAPPRSTSRPRCYRHSSAQADGLAVTVAPRSPTAVVVHAPNVVVGNEESIDVDEVLERMDQIARLSGTAERGSASESAGPLLGVVSTAPAVPAAPPLCLCNAPAKLERITDEKSTNFGRRFWTCSLPVLSDERCDLFQWSASDGLPAAAANVTAPEVMCPACTFMNRPGRKSCKVCRQSLAAPVPANTPASALTPASASEEELQLALTLSESLATSTAEPPLGSSMHADCETVALPLLDAQPAQLFDWRTEGRIAQRLLASARPSRFVSEMGFGGAPSTALLDGPVPVPDPSGGGSVCDGASLLQKRLASMRLAELPMADDGNCQFRAFSHGLFGTQEHHGMVRALCLAHMRSRSDEIAQLVGDGEELERYLASQEKYKTWGDELTLKYTADAFDAVVHVVTSNERNWYLHYDPSGASPASDRSQRQRDRHFEEHGTMIEGADSALDFGRTGGRKQVFLSYIAPLHYNAIVLPPDDISEGRE
jgi:hypothetical protein